MRNIVTQPRVLANIKSKSNPNKSYEIRLGGDGIVYCTCRAWITNKYCKHLEEYHSRNVPSSISTSIETEKSPMLKFFEEQTATAIGAKKEEWYDEIIKNGIINGKWGNK